MRKGGKESVKPIHAIDISSAIRLHQQLKDSDRRGYGLSPRALKPRKNRRNHVEILFVLLYLKNKDARIQPNLGMLPQKNS